MSLKPRQEPYSLQKRLPERRAVSIAIGLPFMHKGLECALVCADSKIVASDWATTTDTKVSLSLTPRSSAFAIASANEDAEAAKMLADQISERLCSTNLSSSTEIIVKKTMTAWNGAYGARKPPEIQFVLIAAVAKQCSLFYCSPPNTVLKKTRPFAIGSGARAVCPLLPDETRPATSAESAMFRAAYWMYRAKRDEGSFCGGRTHAVAISQNGGFDFLENDRIKKIEEFSGEIDRLLGDCLLELLSWKSKNAHRRFLKTFSASYLKLTGKILASDFRYLKYLDRRNLKRR